VVLGWINDARLADCRLDQVGNFHKRTVGSPADNGYIADDLIAGTELGMQSV
jgi:hypothetical protein